MGNNRKMVKHNQKFSHEIGDNNVNDYKRKENRYSTTEVKRNR